MLTQNQLWTDKHRDQDRMNEYKWQALKQYTVKKKDLVWYIAGINKLIDRYKKCLARYGDNVEK